jgi:hypothetical protein
LITIVEIASNASSVFDKTGYAKKAKATNESTLLHPSFIGSKQRSLMKKEAILKRKGLKKERYPVKTEATP